MPQFSVFFCNCLGKKRAFIMSIRDSCIREHRFHLWISAWKWPSKAYLIYSDQVSKHCVLHTARDTVARGKDQICAGNIHWWCSLRNYFCMENTATVSRDRFFALDFPEAADREKRKQGEVSTRHVDLLCHLMALPWVNDKDPALSLLKSLHTTTQKSEQTLSLQVHLQTPESLGDMEKTHLSERETKQMR